MGTPLTLTLTACRLLLLIRLIHGTVTVGRRKIEMEYLVDDRVRKVTFCKRKGGLFKKADDLAKLCGVEVAVLIVQDNKTQHFATSELGRVVTNFQALNTGQLPEASAEDMWKRVEAQRREIEALQRDLADERKKVEALVGGELQMLTVHAPTQPLPLLETLPSSIPAASLPASHMAYPVALNSSSPAAAVIHVSTDTPVQSLPQVTVPVPMSISVAQSDDDEMPLEQPREVSEKVVTQSDPASDEISLEEGADIEAAVEPAAKRSKVEVVDVVKVDTSVTASESVRRINESVVQVSTQVN